MAHPLLDRVIQAVQDTPAVRAQAILAVRDRQATQAVQVQAIQAV